MFLKSPDDVVVKYFNYITFSNSVNHEEWITESYKQIMEWKND